MTKGYKATKNYKCLDQIYEIGQEYKLDGKPILCYYGFHYCVEAENVLFYYGYDVTFKLLEIEDLNPNDTITKDGKSCSNHIKIIREITDKDELFSLLGCLKTYNENGRELTHKSSTGFSCERTYDSYGRISSYKDSNGVSHWWN